MVVVLVVDFLLEMLVGVVVDGVNEWELLE